MGYAERSGIVRALAGISCARDTYQAQERSKLFRGRGPPACAVVPRWAYFPVQQGRAHLQFPTVPSATTACCPALVANLACERVLAALCAVRQARYASMIGRPAEATGNKI